MSMPLPKNNSLPISKLAGVFNSTTNSYKYFWLLAIINIVAKKHRKKIKFSELVVEIISLLWYPINYYNISFGKQDKLYEKIFSLRDALNLPVNLKRNDLLNIIKENHENAIISAVVKDITRYVPYRFLAPWFNNQLAGLSDSSKNQEIANLSNSKSKNKPFYRIDKINKTIEITDEWYEYLYANMQIINDFTYWNLLQYLEKRNPNVPNISQKLFEPVSRKLNTAREFWNTAINEVGNIKCIYSNEIIHPNNYAIDHYIPWSFVTHDKLWNLIPTTNQINSIKSNNVPAVKYFDKFAEIQFSATRIILSEYRSKKLLEDYLLLFRLNLDE